MNFESEVVVRRGPFYDDDPKTLLEKIDSLVTELAESQKSVSQLHLSVRRERQTNEARWSQLQKERDKTSVEMLNKDKEIVGLRRHCSFLIHGREIGRYPNKNQFAYSIPKLDQRESQTEFTGDVVSRPQSPEKKEADKLNN
eukprot:Trichotokara_eunicae@DN46_c0_g1_i1.p1